MVEAVRMVGLVAAMEQAHQDLDPPEVLRGHLPMGQRRPVVLQEAQADRGHRMDHWEAEQGHRMGHWEAEQGRRMGHLEAHHILLQKDRQREPTPG